MIQERVAAKRTKDKSRNTRQNHYIISFGRGSTVMRYKMMNTFLRNHFMMKEDIVYINLEEVLTVMRQGLF
jgi:hypothetical protein